MLRGCRGPTDGADELHLDACVLQPLTVLGTHGDGAADRLAVHVQRHLFAAALVLLDVDHGAVVAVGEDDVDVDRGREEHGHDGYWMLEWLGGGMRGRWLWLESTSFARDGACLVAVAVTFRIRRQLAAFGGAR
jgi:hypothetical protein